MCESDPDSVPASASGAELGGAGMGGPRCALYCSSCMRSSMSRTFWASADLLWDGEVASVYIADELAGLTISYGLGSASFWLAFAIRRLRRIQNSRIKARAKAAMPPTTPPTMAPIGVLWEEDALEEEDGDGVVPGEDVLVLGEAELCVIWVSLRMYVAGEITYLYSK
jgi:hypothetical protein